MRRLAARIRDLVVKPELEIYDTGHLAIGRANLALTAMGLALGGNARAGLEDVLYLRKGELSPGTCPLWSARSGWPASLATTSPVRRRPRSCSTFRNKLTTRVLGVAANELVDDMANDIPAWRLRGSPQVSAAADPFDTGARRSQIDGLVRYGLDLETETIHVLGKGQGTDHPVLSGAERRPPHRLWPSSVIWVTRLGEQVLTTFGAPSTSAPHVLPRGKARSTMDKGSRSTKTTFPQVAGVCRE